MLEFLSFFYSLCSDEIYVNGYNQQQQQTLTSKLITKTITMKSKRPKPPLTNKRENDQI